MLKHDIYPFELLNIFHIFANISELLMALFFKKLLYSFKYAFQGIKFVFLEEQNMKIHVFVSIVVVIAGFIFKLSMMEWVCIVICIGIVFAAETFNTALENMVNLVSPEKHPLAGKIKDLSAAAVVICAIVSVIIGCLIFVPKIWQLLQ